MKTNIIIVVLSLFFIFTLSKFASAKEKELNDYSNEPWEKAALYLGVFIVDANSDLSVGIKEQGLPKVTVDAEDLLGLDQQFSVFRADGFWRITRRNRVDFTYYRMDRQGTAFIGLDIQPFPIGEEVTTNLDISILRGSYAWSFFKDERFDLGIAAGLYGISLDFKQTSEDSGEVEKTEFAAPFPVLGLRGNFALTPKWFIRQSFDFFFLNTGDYEGQIKNIDVAVEWNALKNLGLGVGYTFVVLELEYSGSDDYLDEIYISYGGFQLFGKLYF